MSIEVWSKYFLLKLKTDKLKNIDRKPRKIMKVQGVFHPKSDRDRLYLTTEKGGCGLINSEGYVENEKNNLVWYVKSSVKPFIQGVRLAEVINTKNDFSKDEFKRV